MKTLLVLLIALIASLLAPFDPTGGLAFSAEASSSSRKPGIIIILNGTSSAGKSTLQQKLLENLKRSPAKWDGLSMDEVEDHALSYSDYFKVLNDTLDDEEDLLADLSKRVTKLASTGVNVLCDAVLLGSEVEEFASDLKKLGFKVFTVMVYCSPEQLVCRFMTRNQQALKEFEQAREQDNLTRRQIMELMHSSREHPSQPLQNFASQFKIVTSRDSVAIGYLSANWLAALKKSLNQEFFVFKDHKNKATGRHSVRAMPCQMSTKEIEHTCYSLEAGLGADSSESLSAETSTDTTDSSADETRLLAVQALCFHDLTIDNSSNGEESDAVAILEGFIKSKIKLNKKAKGACSK